MSLTLDIRHARWDRMRDALVIPASGGEVAVTLAALRAIAGWGLETDDAVSEAIDHGAMLRMMAEAQPMIDGVARITASTVNGRDWSVASYDPTTEDAYEVLPGGRS